MGLHNLGDSLMKIGQALMQIGVAGHAMRMAGRSSCCHNDSIFMCGRRNVGFPMYGMYSGGMSGMPGMDYYQNKYMTQAAYNDAYMQGYMLAQQAAADFTMPYSSTRQSLQVSKNPTADAVDKDFDTTQGKALDEATVKLSQEGADEEVHVISDYADSKKTDKEQHAEYRADLTNLGKSYLKTVEGQDGDGYIDEAEWVKYIQKDVEENASEGLTKEKAASIAKIQFKSLDQNQDGKLDYKETASLMYAMDYDYSTTGQNKVDGKITGKSFQQVQAQMGDASLNDTFAQALQKGWKYLFGSDENS